MQFHIIYEDNHILVIEKKPGVLSQGDKSGDPNLVDLIKEYIKIKYNKPGDVYLGLLHRLDRPVGGVMVFAKTSKAMMRLHDQIKSRNVTKLYLAVSDQAPANNEGQLTHYLLKDQDRNITTAHDKEVPNSKLAILNYRLIGKKNGRFLFEIKLITGRSHQIRVQMAKIGCPLLGDVKYGSPLEKPAYVLALYAYSLTFSHPTLRESMTFQYFPKPIGYFSDLESIFPKENIK